MSKPIEILKRVFHDDFSGRRRTRQLPDGVVDIENKRIGQRADIVEPALCDTRLAHGNDDSSDQGESD